MQLVSKALSPPVQDPVNAPDSPHPDPDPWLAATDGQRDRALARLRIVERSDKLALGGIPRGRADAIAAEEAGVSVSAVARWRKLASNAPDPAAELLDLPGRGRRGHDWSRPDLAELWDLWVTNYHRPERPTAEEVWDFLADVAAEREWPPPPSVRTFLRRDTAVVSRRERVRSRDGAIAAMDTAPHQTRTVEGMLPLDAVNGDGKTHDVMVVLPSGAVGRPTVWYWQDVWSRRILAWAAGESESSDLLRKSLHQVVTEWGVPHRAILDNTWAASARDITGGQAGRKRWRNPSPEDELPGLLKLLGIRPHHTKVDRDAAGRGVGRGRAKPVERAFLDVAGRIDRHPRLAGAYTGRSTQDRPETHRQRAADWQTFLDVVADTVARHNARPGRRSEAAAGRSLDATWEEGISRTVVRKITAAQARVLLLSAERVRVDRSGCVTLRAGAVPHRPANRYHHPGLVERAEQRLVARYDPERLHDPVQVYDDAGRWICEAECLLPVGFLDVSTSRSYERARKSGERHARKSMESRRDMDRLLEAHDELTTPEPPAAKPAAVQMVNGPHLPEAPGPRRPARNTSLGSALRALQKEREEES